MPTSYAWYVSSGGSGTSAGPGAGAVAFGTGADGRRPYAFSRQMDPDTGDAVFDESRRSWALGAPLAERVLRCLRTQKGHALRDPSYGVDWTPLDNARSNAAVAAQQAVRTGLQRFLDRGEMRELRIETDVVEQAGAKAFLLSVSFRDPRGTRYSLTGRPT